MSRQEIFDPWPSIYWKCSESTLQFHFEGYKWVLALEQVLRILGQV